MYRHIKIKLRDTFSPFRAMALTFIVNMSVLKPINSGLFVVKLYLG